MRYVPAVLTLTFAVIASCSNQEEAQRITQPHLEIVSVLDSFPEMRDSLPEVRVASAEFPLPPEISDGALVEAVTRAEGKVMIGLKPDAAARTRETGVVPGVSRTTALAARGALQRLGVQIIQSYRNSGAVAAVVAPRLAPMLRRLPMVDYVEALFPGRLMATDTMWGRSHQDTAWGAQQVHAPSVWTGEYGAPAHGEGVWVTMLDGGLDGWHRVFGDGPANVTDCLVMPGAGSSCYADAADTNMMGHGVHVAGIIAARDNDGGGIGIAPQVQGFASIKVCRSDGQCPLEVIAAGLDWVIDQSWSRPRQVLNMSLGWCLDAVDIRQRLATLDARGVLVVASAGNYFERESFAQACPYGADTALSSDWQHGVLYPARYSLFHVMAVAGTLGGDTFAVAPPLGGGGDNNKSGGCSGGADMCGMPGFCREGSRYGPQVQIAAPFWAYSMWSNGRYKPMCGTSMSAPYVTGVAALAWSHNPGWSKETLRSQLLNTAVSYVPANQYGVFGRVDAASAVYSVPPPTYPPPPVVHVGVSGADRVPGGVICQWIAGAWGGAEPYWYVWEVDGLPAGDGTSTLTLLTPGSDFTITVVAYDTNSRSGGTSIRVAVGGVATCNIE